MTVMIAVFALAAVLLRNVKMNLRPAIAYLVLIAWICPAPGDKELPPDAAALADIVISDKPKCPLSREP